jgi:hypothetical protein
MDDIDGRSSRIAQESAMAPIPSRPDAAFFLRFGSLFNEGRALTFPCDAAGRVVIDTLTERARANYLYARAVVGREFSTPAVVPAFPG